MKKNQNDERSQQSDSKSNQSDFAKEKENPQTNAGNPLPVKPVKNIPIKEDLDNRRSIKNRPHLH
ncbi:MAG: hypothetical protein Q8N05_20150 [Bacteroidota bacterium]|nr:hypothetical protein [Bacteroidota bacterium]